MKEEQRLVKEDVKSCKSGGLGEDIVFWDVESAWKMKNVILNSRSVYEEASNRI